MFAISEEKVLLLSVIMSVYNEEKEWVCESVESILRQTYPFFELLIVIDNPDLDIDTRSYLLAVEKKDQRVKLIFNEKNMGLALSLNKAIDLAAGEYIVRMDADDISEEDRLLDQLKYLEKNQLDMIGSGRRIINEKGKVLVEEEKPVTNPLLLKKLLPITSCFVHPTVMIKTNVLRRLAGYRNFRQSQDYDLWLRLYDAGYSLGNINRTLLQYRVRESGISNKKPYLQYLTSVYQKKLHKERVNRGEDSFSSESFQNFLRKKGAYSEKKNTYYAKALFILDRGIGMMKRKNPAGCIFLLYAFMIFPEIFFALLDKVKIVYFKNKFGVDEDRCG
jgi:glycosyltransferase